MLESYDDIKQILRLLIDGLSDILADNLIGLYLTGSLTYGDFDRGSSDIDFFTVLKKKLNTDELSEIEAMHRKIGSKFPEWSKRIEGSYVPMDMLQSKIPPTETRPYVNAGKIWQFPFGDEWLLNLFQLQESGVVLTGKPIEDVIPHVTIKEAKLASRNNLLSEWKPKLDESDPFESNDYDNSHLQVYAILSMCRVLYTHNFGKVASKKKAADWTREQYQQFSPLIQEAQNWKHGLKLDFKEAVLEFIKFTFSVVE